MLYPIKIKVSPCIQDLKYLKEYVRFIVFFFILLIWDLQHFFLNQFHSFFQCETCIFFNFHILLFMTSSQFNLWFNLDLTLNLEALIFLILLTVQFLEHWFQMEMYMSFVLRRLINGSPIGKNKFAQSFQKEWN